MADLGNIAERLNRLVKLALDTGEAETVEDAERLFATYRIQIVVGPDIGRSPVLQAALLTAVNCAARTLLGGVSVIGAQGSLLVRLSPYANLEDALVGLGALVASTPEPHVATLVVGDADLSGADPLALRVTFDQWSGGVAPAQGLRLAEGGDFTPAGVLAGALAVSEIFQRLRGTNPMACRRSVGLNLWRPEDDWRKGGDVGPALERLPRAAWLVGLGNLGQAYLWALGLLPYADASLELVLQDFDVLAASNLSTSLLTTPDRLGLRKTRATAAWAEARGFRTAIIERPFASDFRVGPREPSVALVGVDNALARQQIEDVGFARVIEAGLGRGAQDFLGLDLHTFPAARTAREVWSDLSAGEAQIDAPAYQALLAKSGDRCGIIRLAGRSIGAPFVGAAAAALVVAELLRLPLGGKRIEKISWHLRDPSMRSVIKGEPWAPFNPGTIARN